MGLQLQTSCAIPLLESLEVQALLSAGLDIVLVDNQLSACEELAGAASNTAHVVVYDGAEDSARDVINVLAEAAWAWQGLAESFADGANIYIFGCSVAGDSAGGQELLDSFAELTGADVFASDNLTGADGDWDNEGDEEEQEFLFGPTTVPRAGKGKKGARS